MKLFYCRFYIS